MMTVNTIPKVELHCHLLGTISPALLHKIKQQKQPVLVEPNELAAVYPVDSTDAFTQWLTITRPYQNTTLEYLYPILQEHIGQLITQNVYYTELMISPTMFSYSVDDALQQMADFRKKVNLWEMEKIQVEFVMVIPRTLADDKLRRDTEKFIALYDAGLIVGVALVGLENQESLQRFAATFSRLKQAGLGIEIHAGEHSGAETVIEALDIGLADRIGHGIGAFQQPSLIDRLTRQQVHLEFCVTSNLRTQSVFSLTRHPLKTAFENEMNFSINTDDPGIFDCSLTSEFELVAQVFHLQKKDFLRIFKNSLHARFQPKLRYPNLFEAVEEMDNQHGNP